MFDVQINGKPPNPLPEIIGMRQKGEPEAT